MIRLAVVPALFVVAACDPYPAANTVVVSTPRPTTMEASGSYPDVPQDELCATSRAVAERVMKARQVGIPFNTVMDRVQAVDHAGLRTLSEALTDAAYSQPIHEGGQAQTRAIAEFVSQQEVGCDDRSAAR